jgi:uncharacterized protein
MKKCFIFFTVLLLCLLNTYSQQKNPLINPSEILNAANQLSDSGKYNLAIDTLLTISKGDTSHLQVLTELAYNYLNAKKYAEAIKTADIGLAIPSKYHHRLILIKGNAYDDWGFPDSALHNYNDALKKYPYSYLIYYNMGITNLNAKRYDKAITMFQQSIARNPYHASSHLALGRTMALMGQYTHAMLCLETYLMIEPSAGRSNKNLVFLNNFVNNALGNEYEKIEPTTDNKAFEELDQIIKAGIAMNQGYKPKIKFNAPIAKQTQLLFESLDYKPNTGDFWMENYIPLFLSVKKSNHFEDFAYKILTSTPDENVASELSKRKKEIKDMYRILSEGLNVFSKNQTIIENGTERKVDFILDENNYLAAVGNKAGDGTTRQGFWYFLYPNCEIKAIGSYNNLGKLESKWLNYDDDGSLSFVENYSNGELQGDYTGQYASGNKKYLVKYDKNIANGDVTYYYDCNAISAILHYENGKRNGKGKSFYKNGIVSEEYFYVNDSLEGESKGFYPQGSYKWLYYYKNNKLEGKTIDYYRNGVISTENNFTLGKKNGLFNSYFTNGKLNETGIYKNDLKIGIWKEFNNKGILVETTSYNEKGEMHGEDNGWDDSGKPYYSFIYNNGKLKEGKYFDPKGNILASSKINSKNIPAKGYYADGSVLYDGFYTNNDMDGQWTYYFKSGKIQLVKNFKEGSLNGAYVSYYNSGKKDIESTYSDGLLNGYYKKHYSNGKINAEGWYVNGKQQGKWYYWYPDGSLKETMEFLNDELNGYSESYAPDQKIQFSSYYKNGNIKSLISFDNDSNEINNITFDGTKDYTLYYFDKKIRANGNFNCNSLNSKFSFFNKEGKLETETNYLNDQKDGSYISFYPDGSKKREGFYEEGKMSGLWKYYNEQGKLIKKGFYKNDETDSIWTSYYPDGKIRSVNKFDEGTPIDTAYFYDITGEFMYSLVYDKYGLVSYQFTDPEGKKSININPKDTGTIVTYYKNGKKSSELTFKYGKLEGKQIIYYSNGNKFKSFNLNNDQYDGESIEFFENGNLKYVENYLLDQYHGISKYFRPDGSLERTEEYKSDQEHGSFIFYNEQGKVIKEQKYWGSILLN